MTWGVVQHDGNRVKTIGEFASEGSAQWVVRELSALKTGLIYTVMDLGESLPGHEKVDPYAEIMRGWVENPNDKI